VFDVRGVPTSCVQMVLFGCFASYSVYLNCCSHWAIASMDESTCACVCVCVCVCVGGWVDGCVGVCMVYVCVTCVCVGEGVYGIYVQALVAVCVCVCGVCRAHGYHVPVVM